MPGAMLWYLRDSVTARAITWLADVRRVDPAGRESDQAESRRDRRADAGNDGRARGVQKLTRHPGFVAFSLFGFAHMLMNGWVGDVIFFGTFPALGILGGRHQDQRKLRELGENYRRFVEQTSFFPGAALISGRQHWTIGGHAVGGDRYRYRAGRYPGAFPSVLVRRIADGVSERTAQSSVGSACCELEDAGGVRGDLIRHRNAIDIAQLREDLEGAGDEGGLVALAAIRFGREDRARRFRSAGDRRERLVQLRAGLRRS